jgi:predicted MFS family arabinose efflux permease
MMPGRVYRRRLAKSGESTMNSRKVVIALVAFAALTNLNTLAMFPFLPSIAEDLGTSVSSIGQAMTFSMAAGAIVGLLVGPLSDRYGYRRFLVLGALLMATSCAGTAIASSYGMLIVVRIPGGLATGILGGIGVSIATTRLDKHLRRSAIGWIGSGAAFGAVVGPPVMTTLAGLGNWRTGFWFLAAAPLLLTAVSFRVIGTDTVSAGTRVSFFDTFTPIRTVLADQRSRQLQITTFFWAAPVIGGSSYFGAYLIQEHEFSLSGTGFAYAWAATWLMIAPRVAVKLLHQVQLYLLLVFAGIMMALTVVVVFWMPVGMPWMLFVFAAWTLSMGMGTTLITTAITEAAPEGQGTVMMMRQFTWAVGGALSIAVGGGLIAAGGFTLFGLASGVAALVVAALGISISRSSTRFAGAAQASGSSS